MSFCLEFLLGASVLFAIWLMAHGWSGTENSAWQLAMSALQVSLARWADSGCWRNLYNPNSMSRPKIKVWTGNKPDFLPRPLSHSGGAGAFMAIV